MQINVKRQTTPSTPLSDGNFTYQEEESTEEKVVLSVVGDKGSGKTSLSMSLPGNIYCISLDKKSQSIKSGVYQNDPRIHVIDGLRYFIEEKEKLVDSGAKTYEYILYLIQEIKNKGDCDWLIIDGLKRFSHMAELAMRKKNNIKAFEGFKNRTLWKERNLFLRRFHRQALEIANQGVVYTTYFRLQEITDSKGEMRTEKIPNYTDIIMEETDIVIYTTSSRLGSKRVYLAECDSSKRPDLITSGKVYDITGNTFQLGKPMTEMEGREK